MKYRVFLFLVCFFIVSCGAGSKSDDSEDNTEDPIEVGDDYLDGKWSTGCFVVAAGVYRIQEFTFSKITYSESIVWYEDDSCTTIDTSHDEIHNSGKIVYGGTFRTESGLDARSIDVRKLVSDNPEMFTTYFSIFYIDGYTVYFGDYTPENTGYSADKRHKDLDFNYPLYQVFP